MTDRMDIEGQEQEIEIERYELSASLSSGVNPTSKIQVPESLLSRREFLSALGAGVLILGLIPEAETQESGAARQRGGGAPREIGAWIHVGEDGTVTAFSGKVEVGQNARTVLSQVVAEELRIPISSVKMVMADTDLVPFDAGTFGSQTTPRMIPILREAAAAAREALVDLAAAEWKTDRATLTAANGRVTSTGSDKSATYGRLSKGRKLIQVIGPGVQTTPALQWKVAGHPALKVNAREIVTGGHRYTSDIKRAGMLHGRVLRPETAGARLVSADTRAAESMPGVGVVQTPALVGVVAPSQHLAAKALAAIKAEWQSDPQVSSRELFGHLKKTGSGSVGGGGRGGDFSAGNVEEGLNRSAVRLEAAYTIAYIAHAPLEPRAAVAEWNGDRLTVWTGTQRPFGVRQELASAFGIPQDQIRVIVPDTGSGYGGKHTGDAAIEAARLAKEAGKPVKLVWTREEEFRFAYFRPAGLIEVRAGADRDGTLLAWEFHNYNSGGSAIRSPYESPNQRIAFYGAQSPLRQGSYRALASTANVFARERHIDDLARAAKLDPLAFRLKSLQDERLRAVLTAAAERFGWNEKRNSTLRGCGIACGTEKGSFVACCVEIELQPQANSGAPKPPKFKIVRVVTAYECGAIVNPLHLKNQVEGAVIQGLGGALTESIEFESGRILNPRFSRYRVPRFSDVPPMETVLLDRKELPSVGAGETPIITIAPAIGNAVADATGYAFRSMPMA